MKDADDYLDYIKALIIALPLVDGWKALREEAQGDIGLFRYRISFLDGSLGCKKGGVVSVAWRPLRLQQ